MDYLDTFDVNSTHKKCHRVRSWYLYEQYKALEKNQLDAAQLLKSQSYQSNILRQELKERRARRKLCDEHGYCQNELILNKTIQSCSSVSTHDLYESLSKLHKEYDLNELKENCSCDGSQTSKNNNINELENKNDDISDIESIQSAIDNVIIEENTSHDLKHELEIVKKTIAKNIVLQLEAVKENIQYLEKFTKNKKDNYFLNNIAIDELNDNKDVKNKKQNIFESLFSIWSNLVVFASNSIQLNPGNCYCQCSSQLLMAVLVCDFFRRGVDGICHILQSYVSPIKYSSSESESSVTASGTRKCGCRRKRQNNYGKTYESSGSKHCACNRYKPKTFNRRCCSENKYNSNYLSDNRINERICRGTSEPWRGPGKYVNKNGGKDSRKSDYKFHKFSNQNHCNCNYLKDIVNPILKVARYIENLLQDVEETPVWL